MHQYYDPKLFHVMDERELKLEYAPKERDGVLLEAAEVAVLSDEDKVQFGVDVTSTEHFVAAGFDVTFVGPEDELRGGADRSAREGEGAIDEGEGVVSNNLESDGDGDGSDNSRGIPAAAAGEVGAATGDGGGDCVYV